ncbi:aldose epimerase family protein [Gordonia sp. NPDC003424]
MISVFGGQVVSFVPTGSPDDVLWLSPALAAPPTPLRGGVPVCWPYFAREGQAADVPSHGYARTARWELITGRAIDDGRTELVLAPTGLDHLDLGVTMTLRVGATLEIGLHTRNQGAVPVTITEALHNYFRVSDVRDVVVEGVAGLTYLDKFDNAKEVFQHGDWTLPADPARCDRLYPDARGHYRLVDPGLGRVIEVSARAAATVVVWNPGAEVADGMADVGEHWSGFLCVESANAGPDTVTLAGGGTHTLWQTISSAPLCDDLVELVTDPATADAIADVAAVTFPLACPPDSPPEAIAEFIRKSLSPSEFAHHITDPQSDVLVARDGIGGPIVGYVLLHHRAPTDPDVAAAVTDRPVTEVSKVYVLSDLHAHRRTDGRSPSRALMSAALARAAALGSRVAWLGVNQENVRAQRFYQKMGFTRAGVKTFDLGGRIEHDYVMTADLAGE